MNAKLQAYTALEASRNFKKMLMEKGPFFGRPNPFEGLTPEEVELALESSLPPNPDNQVTEAWRKKILGK